MKIIKNAILLLLLIAATTAKGQMNFQDSSVQVISYWDLGEQHEYAISFQKLKFNNQDTISNETMTYNVAVSVIDSTEDSYTVRWYYKDFKSDSENPVVARLASLSENIPIDIKLDGLGVIQSVENWEEIRDYMAKVLDTLASDYKEIPNMDKIIQQVGGMYQTKASIEASCIQDAQQFHNFHGAKFTLNEELTGQVKTANLYDNNKPFDTEVSIIVEELDEANNQYLIRSIQAVDAAQLTETTFNYLKKMAENLGQEFTERAEFPELKNTVETVSLIHNTGWVVESVLWKEVIVEGQTSMEIRRINLN